MVRGKNVLVGDYVSTARYRELGILDQKWSYA